MKVKSSTILFSFFLFSFFFTDISNNHSTIPFTVKNAEAIIGVPLSPLSVGGVARRTTRRAVIATSSATTTAAATSQSQPQQAQPAPQPQAAAPASTVPIGTIVAALPENCTPLVVSNVSYSECSGAFYKTALQGNNLVYVVVGKPF